ncbi:MAG TPA: peptide ABC transporter substrate-binding protein [Candidatus Baltobacteraceae bacterium]|jgi:peptide/nickel transport system substrate-binding protein
MNVVRLSVAIALCGAILSACSKPETASTGGRNPWTQPHVLRLGEPDEPDSLNPLFANNAAADLAFGMLYSYLLRYDDEGNYIPDLATEVPTIANGGISKDNLTVTVHLRKDAKWADGAPLTADDWMFTYHAVFNKNNNTRSQYGWDKIASVDEPDKYTIVIHLKEPAVAVLGLMAPGSYPPLPAHLLAKYPNLNKIPFNSKPLSSGPYVLTAWNHGASLEFAPNPLYFRGRPKLTKIVWKEIPDTNTLFTQLKTHEIDVYSDVSESTIAQLKDVTGINVSKRLIAYWRRLQFNTNSPLLRDVRVRRAIAEAVDWPNINAKIYHGYNELATSDVFPESWAAPTIPRYPYDVDDAKKLLAAAGWTPGADGVLQKNGTKLHLQISTGTNKLENQQAEVVIQQQLKALGMDIEIKNYPVSLLFAQNGPLYTGHYDMEWTVATNGPDPDNSGNWASRFIPPKGANTAWLNDPIVDRTAMAASSTFDQAKRKALYQQEEERIHALVPAVFFYWENSYLGINTDVKNYKPAAFILDSWNSWEWDI